MIKNAKAKGSRREREVRKHYEKTGATIAKSGGSLGVWDLVGYWEPTCWVAIQVKSNVWPGKKEMENIRAAAPPYTIRLVIRIKDGKPHPLDWDVKVIA